MKPRHMVLALAALLAGCGKKEQAPAPAALSAPDATFAYPGASFPAEAEVTASSGSVQITLRIYKTKLKAKTDAEGPFGIDQSLYYQVELKNLGSRRFVLEGGYFKKPRGVIECVSPDSIGVCLEILGPEGRHPGHLFTGSGPLDEISTDPGIMPGPEDKEGLALRSRWEKQGLSPEAIVAKFEERGKRLLEEYRKTHPEEGPVEPADWLEPGASVASIPWVWQS
ncbi:MAG: hypothetical protein WC943_09295, partial [Elusimicrobiota bacterium]